jgi:hypothetical protein
MYDGTRKGRLPRPPAQLDRLYDSTVALKDATEALREVTKSHQTRLDRPEVLQQALADKKREREREP